MRNHISYTVLGAALVTGASAANAQTGITREIADRPVETAVTQQPHSMLVAQEAVVTVPDGLELLSGSAAIVTMSAVPKSGASSMRFHPATQP